jgi:hypothetical protein
MGKFYIVMKAPKDYVSIMISELEKGFSAEILDWKPLAKPNTSNNYFFSVTVSDTLDKKLEAYCNSKFLKNNEKPDASKPMGKIYDVS